LEPLQVKVNLELSNVGFFKVYLFDEEHSLRRKIRVECIE